MYCIVFFGCQKAALYYFNLLINFIIVIIGNVHNVCKNVYTVQPEILAERIFGSFAWAAVLGINW